MSVLAVVGNFLWDLQVMGSSIWPRRSPTDFPASLEIVSPGRELSSGSDSSSGSTVNVVKIGRASCRERV